MESTSSAGPDRGRSSRGIAFIAAFMLVATACGSEGESGMPAEVPPAAVEPTPPPVAAPPPSRTEGAVVVQATTAPERTANGVVQIPAESAGMLRFAQVVIAEEAFELRSVEFETRGLIGAEQRRTFQATVTISRLPTGALPRRFDASPLPVVARGVGSLSLGPFNPLGPRTRERLTLTQPVEVPAGRMLVMFDLLSNHVEPLQGLELAGRRGAIDGTERCEDHNPDGTFLLVEGIGADGALPVRVPDAEVDADTCEGPSGVAAFNITMRLEGPSLSRAAAEELDASLTDVPLIEALAPSRPPPSAPRATSDPDSSRVRVATYPMSHRDNIVGQAGFWWGPSAFAEVAQSMLVPEAFELEEIRFALLRTAVLEGWQTLSSNDPELSFGHRTMFSGTIPDAVIRVTIWPLDGPGGEQLDMTGVSPITQQMATTDIPVTGYGGEGFARLRLETPVSLEAGYHLVSLGIDSWGDPDTYSTDFGGRNHGHTSRIGFNRDGGTLDCEYSPIPESNDYPHGRAYYRVIGTHSHPMRLENLTMRFREHRSKVTSEELNECRLDPFLPGDLELTLLGRS